MAEEGIKVSSLEFIGNLDGSETLYIIKNGASGKTNPIELSKLSKSSTISNDSNVTGSTVKDAFNYVDKNKIGRIDLVSVTSAPYPITNPGLFYFDSSTKKIYTSIQSGSNLIWNKNTGGTSPLAGIIYVLGSTNYYWDGTNLNPFGTGAGSSFPVINASALSAFDTTNMLKAGEYIISGGLTGFYIGNFNAPYVNQTIISGSQYLVRSIDVSNPNHGWPIWVDKLIGNTGVTKPDVEEIELDSETINYTVTDDTAPTIGVLSYADNGEVILPTDLMADKSVTIIVQQGNPIVINGNTYNPGVTVFAFFSSDSASWTINTILDPKVPSYNDVTVQQELVDANISLLMHDIYRCPAATTVGNLVFVRTCADLSLIGIYQTVGPGYVSMLAAGIVLNIVRNSTSGIAWHSNYDGKNLSSLTFSNFNDKQNKLVDGENIKTVNGESILGSGNIVIEGGNGVDQIQSDWEQSDNTKKDYIKNKPTIPDISNKVDKNGTDRLMTIAEGSKLAGLNEHYRGTYLTLAALQAAIPVGVEGNEAVVDAGIGSDPQKYIWDISDNAWKLGSGTAITVDQAINSGSVNPVSGGSVFNALTAINNEINGISLTPGPKGDTGTSAPLNVTFFKTNANGVSPIIAFKWITNLVVSQILLSYADDISVTIGGTVYNKTTLIGVSIPTGTPMTNLDMNITAGNNSGQVTIIFAQP